MKFDELFSMLRGDGGLTCLLESIYSIQESIKMADTIKSVLDRHSIPLPDDDKIRSVEMSDEDGYVKVQLDRKTEVRRLGALLKLLFPNFDDNKIRQLVDDIKSEHEVEKNKHKDDIEFKLVDDVYDFYENCPYELGSCQAGEEFKPDVAKFYATQKPNLKVLTLYKNGDLSGRALLWSHVENAKDGMFLDRTYPATDMEIKNHYIKYAIKNGWTYRSTNEAEHPNHVSNTSDGGAMLNYQCVNVDDINIVPYMDTFRFGNPDGGFSNFPSNKVHTYKYVDGTYLSDGSPAPNVSDDDDQVSDDDDQVSLELLLNIEAPINDLMSNDSFEFGILFNNNELFNLYKGGCLKDMLDKGIRMSLSDLIGYFVNLDHSRDPTTQYDIGYRYLTSKFPRNDLGLEFSGPATRAGPFFIKLVKTISNTSFEGKYFMKFWRWMVDNKKLDIPELNELCAEVMCGGYSLGYSSSDEFTNLLRMICSHAVRLTEESQNAVITKGIGVYVIKDNFDPYTQGPLTLEDRLRVCHRNPNLMEDVEIFVKEVFNGVGYAGGIFVSSVNIVDKFLLELAKESKGWKTPISYEEAVRPMKESYSLMTRRGAKKVKNRTG
jgi:hypothetical protein